MENSELQNLRVWSKYLRVWSKCLRKLRPFHLRVFGFGYGAKCKTRIGKTLEISSRVFRELQALDLTGHFGSDFPLRRQDACLTLGWIIYIFGVSENETNLQYENCDQLQSNQHQWHDFRIRICTAFFVQQIPVHNRGCPPVLEFKMANLGKWITASSSTSVRLCGDQSGWTRRSCVVDPRPRFKKVKAVVEGKLCMLA